MLLSNVYLLYIICKGLNVSVYIMDTTMQSLIVTEFLLLHVIISRIKIKNIIYL